MDVPILSGVYVNGSEFRTAYPINYVPVPKSTGMGESYLKPAEGIVQAGTGPGAGRGGIDWNGTHYRVMGSKLVSVSAEGVVTTLGDVGLGGPVTMDYSFDRLMIASGGRLYYWDGSLTQVTDPDLGTVVSVQFVDGYTMTTDGEFIVVTELNDPTAVNPLKYGSAEVDPDPIVRLLKVRNEPQAVGRYSIEAYQNVGGDNFPFQRIEGAMIPRGAVGTHACCVYDKEAIAFVGGGRNEAVSVWIGINGGSTKIATREVEQMLSGYSEAELSLIQVEQRLVDWHRFLYLHLPDKTLCYDSQASEVLKQPAWFILSSNYGDREHIEAGIYNARNWTFSNGKWWCDHPSQPLVGNPSYDVSSHWGQEIGWSFQTVMIYNDAKGAQFHELELICLTGNSPFGKDPIIWTRYSVDGALWSQPRYAKAGKRGLRNKRIMWLNQGSMKNRRIQRFTGTSDAHLSVVKLSARIEGLTV